MTETTHLGLPYLAAAQAQKHVTHNEALSRLDAVVQLAVVDTTVMVPPVSPAPGDRYIVADGATGAWAGHDGEIAAFVDGAWILIEAAPGWMAFDDATEVVLLRHDGAWVAAGNYLGTPTWLGVNTEADATNRLAVRSNAVLFTGVEAAEAGTGDIRFVINKEADGDTASLLFQSGFSGRAEVGLAGDTDFVVKVSADGAAWTEAIRIDKDTGLATLGADPSAAMHAATKQYVDQIVAAQDAMVFKGVVDCSANPNYPAGARGWTYRVSVAGKIGGGSGVNVEAGDLLICLTDGTASGNQATVGANWSIAQANLDGAVVGPASVTDGVPVLFDGVTGKLIKASTFSAFKTALALVKADVGLGNVLNVPQREQITASRTYYVRTDGSDSNSGLVDSSGGAFLTIQKAIDVTAALDMGVYQVTMQVKDGTYTGGNTLRAYVGLLPPIIQGNSGTPANVLISTTSADCFVSDGVAPWSIKDMKLQAATSGRLLYAKVGGKIFFSNLVFGAAVAQQLLAEYTGIIRADGNYAVSAGAQYHMQAAGGQVLVAFRTITFSNSPAYTGAFAVANRSGGNIDAYGMTFTNGGTVTGKRYDASLNASITVAGASSTYFPGDVAGTTATGAQYA